MLTKVSTHGEQFLPCAVAFLEPAMPLKTVFSSAPIQFTAHYL